MNGCRHIYILRFVMLVGHLRPNLPGVEVEKVPPRLRWHTLYLRFYDAVIPCLPRSARNLSDD